MVGFNSEPLAPGEKAILRAIVPVLFRPDKLIVAERSANAFIITNIWFGIKGRSEEQLLSSVPSAFFRADMNGMFGHDLIDKDGAIEIGIASKAEEVTFFGVLGHVLAVALRPRWAWWRWHDWLSRVGIRRRAFGQHTFSAAMAGTVNIDLEEKNNERTS